MKQEITIKNLGNKDQNVILYPGELSEILKVLSAEYDEENFIFYERGNNNIEVIGAESFLEHFATNPTIKDLIIRSDSCQQLKTTMSLYKVNYGGRMPFWGWQYLPFTEFVNGDSNEAIVDGFGVKLNINTVMAFEMKAGCSLSLTFIYQ